MIIIDYSDRVCVLYTGYYDTLCCSDITQTILMVKCY